MMIGQEIRLRHKKDWFFLAHGLNKMITAQLIYYLHMYSFSILAH